MTELNDVIELVAIDIRDCLENAKVEKDEDKKYQYQYDAKLGEQVKEKLDFLVRENLGVKDFTEEEKDHILFCLFHWGSID